MEKRTLTITLQADWQSALRSIGNMAEHTQSYQGETLNFESPASFFAYLTERRWIILNILQKTESISIGELAKHLARETKSVYEDIQALLHLDLIEIDEKGVLSCPFQDIHVDMHLIASKAA